MAVDLIIYGSSADRSAADVNIPVNSGETIIAKSGNYGIPKAPGAIKGAFVNSETAAMVECWFKKTTENDRKKLVATHLQTDPLRTQAITYLNHLISPSDQIEAAGENAGAVLDVLGMYWAKNMTDQAPTPFPPGPLPANAISVAATGAATLTADVLCAPAAITFEDFVPLRDVWYKVIGMSVHGQTACASRLRFINGPNVGDAPGVPAADTSTGLEYQCYYGDFGMFLGQDGLQHQTIGVAGDTAQVFRFILVPMSGGGK